MRIIAGQRRGHKFEGPKGTGTRPTSDLVRESLFNILGGSVAGQVVVDLFAGTGARGLEALSRGATRAIFVERNRANVALIDRNLATLRFEDRALVLATDAYRWARAFEAIDDEPMVVLLDPPYREFEVRAGKVNQLLRHLVEVLSPDSIVVVEARAALDARVLPDITSWDVRRYGGTQVAIRALARPAGPEPSRFDAGGPPS
jgi:16S rRNA (guanine966-N2)-methyltransferase